MEWLIAHEGELDNLAESSSSNAQPAATAKDQGAQSSTSAPQSDEFRPEETAVETAARKKITVEEAQRLITERAALRAEEDRKKAIEDEKKRRLDGQKMIQTRAELEDLDRQLIFDIKPTLNHSTEAACNRVQTCSSFPRRLNKSPKVFTSGAVSRGKAICSNGKESVWSNVQR